MTGHRLPWDEARVKRLKELWPRHSAAEIARIMKREGMAITRNSVMGKVHRLRELHELPAKTSKVTLAA